MATVSRVKMTTDLRLASVYVTVFGGEERIADTLAGFKNSKGFIKNRSLPNWVSNTCRNSVFLRRFI